MTIGESIQQARKKAGLSQRDLGLKLGVSGSMIGQYENNLRRPKAETIRKIAEALNTDTLEITRKGGKQMIELPEGLVIISDEHCYIVGNPRKSRGKGVEIKNPKYYAHIDQAIQGALALILRLKVKNKEITTLRQFLDEQASLNQGLRDMLTPQNSGGEAVETRGDEPATVAEGNYIPDKAERKKRHV